MAHLYLQEDPKTSVAGSNDAPATIPTPEQLGSLLITYGATGSTGQTAAAYAALEVGGTPQWVPIAGAGGIVGPTGGGTPDHVAKFVTPTTIGDAQIIDNALTGINIAPVAGNVVIAAPATGLVSIENPQANVTVGSGGSNQNIDVTVPGGSLDIIVGDHIGLNGALFLGSFSVATLPSSATQAFAFATDVRNLDSGAAYPAIEAVGTGGLVIRGADGVWRLSGTNIIAQA